jgi:hypothetical protein
MYGAIQNISAPMAHERLAGMKMYIRNAFKNFTNLIKIVKILTISNRKKTPNTL